MLVENRSFPGQQHIKRQPNLSPAVLTNNNLRAFRMLYHTHTGSLCSNSLAIVFIILLDVVPSPEYS